MGRRDPYSTEGYESKGTECLTHVVALLLRCVLFWFGLQRLCLIMAVHTSVALRLAGAIKGGSGGGVGGRTQAGKGNVL